MQVIMTRTGDDPYHTIGYAADRTNDADPALAVSIHANAGGGTGTEACYQDLKDTTPQSMALARRLTEAVSSRLSLTNRGIYSEYGGTRRCNGDGGGLYIHNMRATAALIETAFLDHPRDAEKLRDRRQDFAQAIAEAILAHLRG